MQGEALISSMCTMRERWINPALAEAQVHGGMSMGIGWLIGETNV